MAITKGKAAPAEKPKAEKPAVKAAPKAAPKPEAEVAKVEVKKVSRKDIAASIRDSVKATGGAISEKLAEVVTVAYEEAIIKTLTEGGEVNLPGFGRFIVTAVPEREATNPQKPGEKVVVPAHNAVKFKVGSKLKSAVNAGEEGGDE